MVEPDGALAWLHRGDPLLLGDPRGALRPLREAVPPTSCLTYSSCYKSSSYQVSSLIQNSLFFCLLYYLVYLIFYMDKSSKKAAFLIGSVKCGLSIKDFIVRNCCTGFKQKLGCMQGFSFDIRVLTEWYLTENISLTEAKF